jgi:hypothetical protein
MSLALYAQGLRARFDLAALRPPAAAVDEAGQQARDPAAWAALQAWCRAGAGPGGSAWSQPGGRPAVTRRLAVAVLQTPGDGACGASTLAFANALARGLDGSLRLAALSGPGAGLRLRLGVKARDAMWWRARRPDDPWDAGWALDTPAAQQQWHAGFAPRRATLILADGRAAASLQPVLAALAARSAEFRHPVRWLWVGGVDAPSAPGLALARVVLT